MCVHGEMRCYARRIYCGQGVILISGLLLLMTFYAQRLWSFTGYPGLVTAVLWLIPVVMLAEQNLRHKKVLLRIGQDGFSWHGGLVGELCRGYYSGYLRWENIVALSRVRSWGKGMRIRLDIRHEGLCGAAPRPGEPPCRVFHQGEMSSVHLTISGLSEDAGLIYQTMQRRWQSALQQANLPTGYDYGDRYPLQGKKRAVTVLLTVWLIGAVVLSAFGATSALIALTAIVALLLILWGYQRCFTLLKITDAGLSYSPRLSETPAACDGSDEAMLIPLAWQDITAITPLPVDRVALSLRLQPKQDGCHEPAASTLTLALSGLDGYPTEISKQMLSLWQQHVSD